ncbi:hypothetical protein FRB94_003447 [Tulasnella sp. JGI-2019a]|nr:hypothetical protein FRB93_005311 [Tulasnella sp. JGI-2019a]KAG9002976.1 hypothetical protein FRB94_003447 [Tulasnella sp. JGI-2019a]
MAGAPRSSIESPYIVFGYGSLIWKPPQHTVHRIPGFLKGYVRRFAQSSWDHRGTPENPGRVVTLIHSDDWQKFSSLNDPFPEDDIVWGVAYTIDPTYAVEVKAYLDDREKAGYTEETVDIWGIVDGKEEVVVSQATIYVGKINNPDFVGSEPIDQLARHIHSSEGPSGKNKDYFYELARAVRELAPESSDSHLTALEVRIPPASLQLH